MLDSPYSSLLISAAPFFNCCWQSSNAVTELAFSNVTILCSYSPQLAL